MSIFGTGFVSEVFFKSLEINELSGQVYSFVTTSGGDQKYGKKIQSIEEFSKLKKRPLLCLAVHEAIVEEIKTTLDKFQIENYVWIYSNLYELSFGGAICSKKMKTAELWQKTDVDFKMCIIAPRILAIDEYWGLSSEGCNLYKRMQSVNMTMATAERRLERFCKLIENVTDNGYDDNYPVCIFENSRLFDGAHRFSLALYLGIKEINVEVFSEENSQVVNKYLEMNQNIKKFIENNFTSGEKKLLYDAIQKIDGRLLVRK